MYGMHILLYFSTIWVPSIFDQWNFRAKWYLPIENQQYAKKCSHIVTLAPVWLDSINYSSTFHLVTLSEEVDCVRKYEEQKNAHCTPETQYMEKENASIQFISEIAEWNNANLPFTSDKDGEISERKLR